LNKRAKELNYENKSTQLLKDAKTIYEHKISFGDVKVLKKSNDYFLYMSYLGDNILLFDASQNNEIEQKENIDFLIGASIVLLIVIFLIVLKMLIPLQDISKAIEKFGEGDYALRLKEGKSKDEISKVAKKFNAMAKNLENLIKSRKELLRDISHELRTPISKAKISLEMIEDSKYKIILKKSINQIDKLTNELLEIERLNSDNIKLDIQNHSIDTILAETFSKMIIEDEEDIDMQIKTLFDCNADINYLSMAIKNLIDNALKYKESGKVEIIVDKNVLEIKNQGKALSRDLEFYMQTFTQEDKTRNIKGYGLGLNIVKRVLQHHKFDLKYRYEDGKNVFSINTKQTKKRVKSL
jgi:two-component system OmpR family sensor kinase